MAGSQEARFSLPFDSNAGEVGRDGAKALEELRQKVQGSQNAIREMSASLKTLRGSSDEVKAAKDQLKAKIEAERNAMSAASLQILKAGSSYEKLAQQSKQAANAPNPTDRATDALKGLDIVGRGTFRHLSELKNAFSGLSTGGKIAAVGIVALTVVITALVAATLKAAEALGKFIIESGNAQRSMLLTQEGLLGSAQSARNFADQVDDIRSRVPLAADEVAKLGDELAGKGLKGQPLVDAMNAIAQTTAAKGQAAGDKLKEKLVASLGAGAKQAREAAEKQFGQLNARKMLDLTVQAQHFKDTLASLTRDVNLEPLLEGLHDVLSVFDQSTVSGQAIKELVTLFGDGLSSAVGGSAPLVKTFLKQLLIYILEGTIAFLQIKRQIKETFGPDTIGGVDAMNVALGVAKFAVQSMVYSLVATYAAWRAFEAAVGNVVNSFKALFAVGEQVKKALTGGWSDVGKTIVTGLVSGITGGAGALTGAITGLADKVKGGFKSALGIKSPSKVFEEYGQHTAAGFEKGVSGPAGDSASDAASSMVAPPQGARSGGGPAIGALHLHVEAGGGGNAQAVAKAVSQPSVIAALTKVLEDAVASAGYTPAPGGA